MTDVRYDNVIDVSSVYVIGDWNAEINANSVFGSELSSFCTDHSYIISDIEHLGIDSGCFTFVSEAHSTSWIDHWVCTGQAHASISSIHVIYDTQSSDHFPLRQCKRDEASVRADILTNDLVKRNSTLFWNHVSKQHRRCIIPADTVGGTEPLVENLLLPCGKITTRICSIVWIPNRTKNLL